MEKELVIRLQKMLHETFLLLNGIDVKGQDNIRGMWNAMTNLQSISKELSEAFDNKDESESEEPKEE